eukprot:m.137676 g.137676  ORF g.137676 m.137676 type:complete len:1103 (+) comp38226_c0_seq2:916-4224(+)
MAGSVPEKSYDHLRLLCKVAWKAVINFDPDSETHGLFKAFETSEGKPRQIQSLHPQSFHQAKISEVANEVDWKMIPWLFATGRYNDSIQKLPKEDFEAWRRSWFAPNRRFLQAMVEQLDRQIPLVTIAMPFKKSELPYMELLVQRLDEMLRDDEVTTSHVVIHTEDETATSEIKDLSNEMKQFFIPAKLMSLGLATSLGYNQSLPYQMPSSVEELPVSLKETDFLYVSEYLTLLYRNCEMQGIDPNLAKEEMDQIVQSHQKSFLSGQLISMLSLKYDHDARRDLVNTFSQNILRQLERQTMTTAKPTVIELVHNPGTGGSTIARRILWELRLSYPCAIVKEAVAEKIQGGDDEEECIRNISVRIAFLEKECAAVPLILLDGESSFLRLSSSSRRIAEHLLALGHKKAVILHCLRGKSCSKTASHFSKRVAVTLSTEDNWKFKEKYGKLLRAHLNDMSRVFYFPLMSFFGEYKSKFQKMIFDALENSNEETDKPIFRFAAVLQHFAGRSVPPDLVYDLFLKTYAGKSEQQCSPLYEDIYNMLSEQVKSLLVQVEKEERFTYDLQHPVVAETILNKLFGETLHFLPQYILSLLDLLEAGPVYIKTRHASLFEDLFLYNKNGDNNLKFSVLMNSLKSCSVNPDIMNNILRKAALVFQSYRFYSHFSRFYVYNKPPLFGEAEEMIEKGFAVVKRPGDLKHLWDTRGLIYRSRLQMEIKDGNIKSIEQLEEMASLALEEYRLAISASPSWPNPLIAKVQVYLSCFDWILKHSCDGEIARLLDYLFRESPGCFRNSLDDCFHMIDTIEKIVATQSLSGPETTVSYVEECKIRLCFLKSADSRNKKKTLSKSVARIWEDLVKGVLRFNPATGKKDVKKYQVYFFLYHCKLEVMRQSDRQVLFDILVELVEQHNELSYLLKLFKVGNYLESPPTLIDLDRCIHLANLWKSKLYVVDPFIWFYLYMFYFLKILEGSVVECSPEYTEAVNKCSEVSLNQINRFRAYFYLGKGTGLPALVHPRTLDIPEDNLGEFWKKASRRLLRELKGRIVVKTGARKDSKKVFIELVSSGVEVYAAKMLQELGRDFRVGQLVAFVVSFHLRGPTAHGVVPL